MPTFLDRIKQFRRELHAYPEVSGKERETAARIAEFLKNCGPDELLTEVGGHGILAVWNSGVTGQSILLRAELDALPIEEVNTFEHKSKKNGISHKCGHDGHSAILCGVAQILSERKPKKGKVCLLFQPAEEIGEGAESVLQDSRFKKIDPDFVFALHNLPGYPSGKVVLKQGVFTAAVNSIIINLFGKTAHAAEPEHGINPALAVAEILEESALLSNNSPQEDGFRVVTPIYTQLGEKAYGISAGTASIHLTFRCWNDDDLLELEREIEQLCTKIATKNRLKIEFEYTQTFRANVNDSLATEIVRKAAVKKGISVVEQSYPFKWGEDFGLFTSRYRGCMFGLGAGESSPALHNPDYDFPDEIIEPGILIFEGIINQLLNDS